jgi:hypothetical protein
VREAGHLVELDAAIEAIEKLNDRGHFREAGDMSALAQSVDAGIDNIGAAFQTGVERGGGHADIVMGMQRDFGARQAALHLANPMGEVSGTFSGIAC